MFNEDLKKDFIEYKEKESVTPVNYLTRMFNKTAEIEVESKQDASQWNLNHIMEYYKKLGSTSVDSLVVANGYLGKYTDWMMRNGKVKSGDNPYNGIRRDMLEECLDKDAMYRQYMTEDVFKEGLGELLNPCDQFILVCLWEGIKGKGFEDIWRLKLNDISDDSVWIEKAGCYSPVRPWLRKYAKMSADEFEYQSMGDERLVVLKLFGEPDQIIKQLSTSQGLDVSDHPVMVQRQNKNIYRKMMRITSYLGWNGVHPKNVLVSGQMNYVELLAQQNNITPSQVLQDELMRHEVEQKYKKIKSEEEFLSLMDHR